VTGQHDAAPARVAVLRGKCREQVRLATIVVEGQRRRGTEVFEIRANPFDELEIRIAA